MNASNQNQNEKPYVCKYTEVDRTHADKIRRALTGTGYAGWRDEALAALDGLLAALAAATERAKQAERIVADHEAHHATQAWRDLEAQLAAAHEALTKYGNHSERCARYQHDWRIKFPNTEPTCLCGFGAALAASPPDTGDTA